MQRRTSDIVFTLVVDDFGASGTNKDELHLLTTLKVRYIVEKKS
jgi:hypothetical protein